VGVEITAPPPVPLERLNQLLATLGEPPLAEQDPMPASTVFVAGSRLILIGLIVH
jgi:hypothetical protein